MKVEFYILSLAVTIASFSLSIASLNLPQISTKNSLFESNLYFFKKCDKSNWNGDQGTTCYSFPTTEDCPRNKKENENGKRPFDFCDSWLLAGYSQSLSLGFGGLSILSLLVTLIGGRAKRADGWRALLGFLSVHAVAQILSMSLIVHAYNNENRFFFGSRLDSGFIVTTISWSLDVVICLILGTVGSIGLREDEYVAF